MKKLLFSMIVICITLWFFNFSLFDRNTLTPFISDGCSMFPDGTIKQKELWLNCCIQHDYEYWQGGTYQQKVASDQALKICVTDVGQPEIAALMMTGVSVGGTAYLPTKFRWGYGWPYPRLYGALSIEEQKKVKALQPLTLNNAID
ncbi:hypothetical protein [Colwellia sp. Arc7-635]|uniref:hypothetical protein n=1 Tax=Colwellia sp. Arc7-635 TaxID=2497879 RepID=UPI0026ADF46A